MFPTTVLTNNLPSEWSDEYYENIGHYLVPIEPQCSEYQNIAAKVTGSFNGGITSIERVQNPFMYGRFLLKQEEYRSRGINFEIKELLHATEVRKVESIVRDNFDWRLTWRKNKFGQGLDFSSSPSYANMQCSRLNWSKRAMIITDVIVEKFESGRRPFNNNVQSLPIPQDITVDNSFSLYVKYCEDEFYPKYVVYYLNQSRC